MNSDKFTFFVSENLLTENREIMMYFYGKIIKTTLETSGEDCKSTLETSGKDVSSKTDKTILITHVNEKKSIVYEVHLLHSFRV